MDDAKYVFREGSQDGQARAEAGDHELAISMLLLERRALIRECLARSLSLELPKSRVVAWAGPFDDDTLGQFDLVVVGLPMDGHRQKTQLEKVGELAKKIPVVVMSEYDDRDLSANLLQFGARAQISFTIDLALFIDILWIVHKNGTYFPSMTLDCDELAKGIFRNAGHADINILTPREIDILRLLSEGRPNKIIAYELDICESTVKVHVRHIMGKLGANNRTQAALLAKEMISDEY